jgi:serine/threonine protein kinase
VTSFASGGNLRDLIDKTYNFTSEEIMNYFLMILLSLHYLHSKDIMHRDLNPRNVLVDVLPGGFKILQITDFGLSKNANNQDNQTQTLANLTAKFYRAPEVFKGQAPTTKVDMWALGIILCELATKKHPISLETQITDANPLEIPSTIPPLLRTLIANLLDKNPATRPSAIEVLKLPDVNGAVMNLVN